MRSDQVFSARLSPGRVHIDSNFSLQLIHFRIMSPCAAAPPRRRCLNVSKVDVTTASFPITKTRTRTVEPGQLTSKVDKSVVTYQRYVCRSRWRDERKRWRGMNAKMARWRRLNCLKRSTRNMVSFFFSQISILLTMISRPLNCCDT